MASHAMFAEVAALAGDPGRAGMLHALMDGRALTASELARVAGIAPQTALMGLAMAASSAFATPIAHPANLLVMGPGGYRFADYVRLGVPLTLVVFVAVMVLLNWCRVWNDAPSGEILNTVPVPSGRR